MQILPITHKHNLQASLNNIKLICGCPNKLTQDCKSQIISILITIGYAPRGLWGHLRRGELNLINQFFNLNLKRKKETIFLFGGGNFSKDYFQRLVVLSSKIFLNLPCKGEPDRFRCYQDPSVKTYKHLIIIQPKNVKNT